jgi:hypothetical protein
VKEMGVMKPDDVVAVLGVMKIDDWPSMRAASLAAQLLEELRRPCRYGRCDACGHPNEPAGNCSRKGCCNSD